MNKFYILVSAGLLGVSTSLFAEQIIYPANGQSAEQQKKDEAECYTWAVEKSGFDPANPASVSQTAQPQVSHGPTGARLRGATKGAIFGEIVDGDTGDAALAGAVWEASKERRERRTSSQQAQAEAQSEMQANQDLFNRSRAACLEGRGYTVK